MPKHFIKTPLGVDTRSMQIEGELAHHLLHVLRMKIGEPVTLCDGQQTDYDCVIEQIVPKGSTVASGKKPSVVVASAKGPAVTLSVTSVRRCDTEPATKIYLFQALPKGDKLEWIIQKCVELGVHAIVPLITDRSVVRVNKDWRSKTERYQRIAESAAAQSLRGIIPLVHDPIPFITALDGSRHVSYRPSLDDSLDDSLLNAADKSFDKASVKSVDNFGGNFLYSSHGGSLMDSLAIPPIDLHLLVYEKERQVTIPQVLRGMRPGSVGLWIGPEGGFSDEEATGFRMNAAQLAKYPINGVRSATVTLGRRILRTETAGMAALTQVLCALEDIL